MEKYSLKNHYSGRYHSIPNVLLSFLPSDTYIVFAQIYVASHDVLFNGRITLSKNMLVTATKMGWRKVNNNIDLLGNLNILKSYTSKQTTSYQINWDEVYAIDQFCMKLSRTGISNLSKICTGEQTPFTKLTQEQLNELSSQYGYDKKQDLMDVKIESLETDNTEMTEPHGDVVQNDSTTLFGTVQMTEPLTSICRNDRTSNVKLAEMTEPLTSICRNDRTSNVKLAEMTEPLTSICRNDRTSNVKLAEMTEPQIKICSNDSTSNNEFAQMTVPQNQTCRNDRTSNLQNTLIKDEKLSFEGNRCYFSKDNIGFKLSVRMTHTESLLVDAAGVENIRIEFIQCADDNSNFVQNDSTTLFGTVQMTVPKSQICRNDSTTLFGTVQMTVPLPQTCSNDSTSTSKSAEMTEPPCSNDSTYPQKRAEMTEHIRYNKDKKRFSTSEASTIIGGEHKTNEKIENDEIEFEEDEIKGENTFNWKANFQKKKKSFEEKNNSLKAYFEDRDLTYPILDYETFKDDYFQEPSEEDDDVMRMVKQVWPQLEYEQGDTCLQYITFYDFYRILYNSWEELKLRFEDFELSEQEAKNIFGFEIVEHEGCYQLLISPYKLRDVLSNHKEGEPAPLTEAQKKIQEMYKYGDRSARSYFRTCLLEYIDKDEKNLDLLTSAEYLIYIMAAEERKAYNEQGRVIPLTLAYESTYKERLAEESGVELSDVEYILKQMPRMGTEGGLIPRCGKFIPDKVFEINRKYGEESVFEEVFDRELKAYKEEKARLDKEWEEEQERLAEEEEKRDKERLRKVIAGEMEYDASWMYYNAYDEVGEEDDDEGGEEGEEDDKEDSGGKA